MHTADQIGGGIGRNDAPDWPGWLAKDPSLTPGWRESYRRTLAGFEQFCRKRGSGADGPARPPVALAREYVEVQRLEQAPGPARLQEWKEALNWLFRCRRCPPGAVLTGVPPLGRADLGRTPWEQRLVQKIRVRPLSWRTEQTYRGWAWRLAHFLGERPVWPAAPRAEGIYRHLPDQERLESPPQRV